MNQELRQAAAQAKEALESIIEITQEEHFIRSADSKLYETGTYARRALSALSAVLDSDSSHLAAPTDEARSGSGVPARPTSPGEDAPTVSNDDLKELAYSAYEEALSFGLSHDVFMRYFKTIRNRAASPLPQEDAKDAARYRWLRVRGAAFAGDHKQHLERALVYRIGNLDEAIDAMQAMEGKKP